MIALSLADVILVYVFMAGLAVGATLGYLIGLAKKGNT